MRTKVIRATFVRFFQKFSHAIVLYLAFCYISPLPSQLKFSNVWNSWGISQELKPSDGEIVIYLPEYPIIG